MDYTPEMRRKFREAPRAVKDILAEMIMDGIISSDYPEESKIEVRLMKICKEIEDEVNNLMTDFATPLPSHDPEGKEVQRKAFPARQACLEYLQLVKGGLDTFRQQVPAPEIPEKFKKPLRDDA